MKTVFIYEAVSPGQKRKIRSMVERKIGRMKRREKNCRYRRAFLVLEVRPADDEQNKWEASGQIEFASGQISVSGKPSSQPVDAAASVFDKLEQELRKELLTHPRTGKARYTKHDKDRAQANLETEAALAEERIRKVGNILASARDKLLSEAKRAISEASEKTSRGLDGAEADDLVEDILLRAWPEVEAGMEGAALERRLHQLLTSTIDNELRRTSAPGSVPGDPSDEKDRLPITPGDDGWLSQAHRS